MNMLEKATAVVVYSSLSLAALSAGATQTAPPEDCQETTLTIVAHQDDDLLFINPDLQDDLDSGRCLTTVFLTAGDAGSSVKYWERRELGPLAAYSTMLGLPEAQEWESTSLDVNGRSIRSSVSSDGRVELLFMRLPDGNPTGRGFAATGSASLQRLWEGEIATLAAIDGSATYTRTELVDTLRAVVAEAAPLDVRIQNDQHSADHSDHRAGARFAREALKGFSGTVSAYLGYSAVDTETPNVHGEQLKRKTDAIRSYGAYDHNLCLQGAKCPTERWTERRYLVPAPGNAPAVPGPAPYTGPNVARNSSVIASSAAKGQEATKAIDARVDGYRQDQSTRASNPGAEWASSGERGGAWIQLKWTQPHLISSVHLYDRPNSNDQILAGRLTFSDGSTAVVPPLNNDGTATVVNFAPRAATSLHFEVTAVSRSTVNVGLAEIEAYTAPKGSPNIKQNAEQLKSALKELLSRLRVPVADTPR